MPLGTPTFLPTLRGGAHLTEWENSFSCDWNQLPDYHEKKSSATETQSEYGVGSDQDTSRAILNHDTDGKRHSLSRLIFCFEAHKSPRAATASELFEINKSKRTRNKEWTRLHWAQEFNRLRRTSNKIINIRETWNKPQHIKINYWKEVQRLPQLAVCRPTDEQREGGKSQNKKSLLTLQPIKIAIIRESN